MPNFNNDDIDIRNISGSSFQYSNQKLYKLDAVEYTLATIAVDTSSSVQGFKTDIKNCIKNIIQACANNPKAENILVRVITFNSQTQEVHGFRLVSEISTDIYDSIGTYGMTALYDATFSSIGATEDFAKQLDREVKGVCYIITDGCDNASSMTPTQIKNLVEKCIKSESLVSFLSILIGLTNDDDQIVADALKYFKTKADITEYISYTTSPKDIAKLSQFISQSISSISNSITQTQPLSI